MEQSRCRVEKDEITGEDVHTQFSGFSGRGTDSFLVLRASKMQFNIQHNTSELSCRDTFRHQLDSNSSYESVDIFMIWNAFLRKSCSSCTRSHEAWNKRYQRTERVGSPPGTRESSN